MRWFVIVAVLGGCGRVDFGSHRGDAGDDAASDAMRDAMPPCPPAYTVPGDDATRFRVVATASAWDAAEAACEADGPGMHLAVFGEAENATQIAPSVGTGRHWIGVSDRITEGTFLFVTGGAATYLPWQAGAPTAGGPDCVSWDPVASTYLDEACTSGRPYVCACDRRAADHSAF